MGLSFRILGPLEVADGDGAPVALGGPRQRAVLAFLLLHRGTVVPAETVATAVWGADAPRTTVTTVRSYVSRLRAVLGGDVLELRRGGFVLAADELDATRFEELVEAGAHDDALALWRGDVLEDLPELASHPEVGRLEELRLRTLETHELDVAELQALVAAHPLRERLWQRLMHALYAAGRQAEALDAYARARAALDELGLEPGPVLADLQRRILRHDLSATNLPAPIGPLIGREAELAALDALLRGTRLVTVTGIGGGGKTRLAVEAARRAGSRHPGGVWFVDLAPLEDARGVPDTIARAVGAAAVAVPPLAAAAEQIGGRETLVVVDNAEHLLPAVTEAAVSLLSLAPAARVLLTSRRRLGVADEAVYVLPPLEEAPQLFAARARAVDASFQPDDREVEAICSLLDNIPLAIELAAARVAVLDQAEIRARLADEGVLGWPGGAAAQRHRSLRTTLAWSHELLSEDARRALRTLSVFAGSFTLAAAEAMGETLATVSELADASLLRVDHGTPTRYRMLDTVRAYGRELLHRADETDDAARAHALHHVALAERAYEAAFAENEDLMLTELDLVYDELRSALGWSLAGADVAIGLRLARALTFFWPTRGHTLEGRAWLERALAVAETEDERADLMGALGVVAVRIGEFGEARRLLEDASRCAGDLERGRWLHALANARRSGGDPVGARESAEASLAVKRELGDVAGEAWTIGFLADCAQVDGDVATAQRLYDEGLELVHAAGDPPRLLVGYTASLAELALRRGDLTAAETLARDAVEQARRLGERWHLSLMSTALGEIARRRGDLERAAAHARAAAREAWEIRELHAFTGALELAARVAADAGDRDRAEALADAARAGFGAGELAIELV